MFTQYSVVYFVTQVYMMSWVERKMAAALFAVPPTATVDEALSHFMQVLSSVLWHTTQSVNSFFLACTTRSA